MRERVAARYNAGLAINRILTPAVIDGAQSVWAQYTIQLDNRAKVQADLKDQGIPTAVYYPIPLSRQKAYAQFPAVPTPNSARLSERVVSLPIHPYLDEPTQDRIIEAVLKSVG
jgi:dTDP-4-amino-4,6-dideoxygalactose transaminase